MRSILLTVPFLVVVILSFVVVMHLDGPVAAKALGRAVECSWAQVLGSSNRVRIDQAATQRARLMKVASRDGDLDLVVGGPRPFWVERSREADSAGFVSYLITDHETIGATFPLDSVQPGEIVMDVGAHCGVFTDYALRRGAAKVFAIEPDPDSVEALKRNFRSEVASGRVVIIPKGAWSSDTVLPLSRGRENSGSNSVVMHTGLWEGPTVNVPLIPLDELNVGRIDFVKMDIEGAEREALRGMAQTIAQWHPRFMLDSYHRPDDMPIFRSILVGYSYTCSWCEPMKGTHEYFPHVTFWRSK